MRDDCVIPESARRCDETGGCEQCGFNPDVEKRRKAAVREKRKSKTRTRAVTRIPLDDALSIAKGRVNYAAKRMTEETEDADIRYWACYRDGAQSVLNALEKAGGGENA